jgi:CBS domain containing-hemolysin-like protein
MVAVGIYIALVVAAFLAFCISLIEATYLTVKRPSLYSMQKGGSRGAEMALKITDEKTKLVSVTTFIDTVATVVLATTMGIAMSAAFGPVGWLVSVVIGSLLIMIFLYLIPKAIGIENPVKMAVMLSRATSATITTMSPVAGPLASLAKRTAAFIGGKKVYREDEISEEMESLIDMLEADGRVGPDAGRMIRTTLASSQYTVMDIATAADKIVSVDADATVMEALKVMGTSHHPRIPMYDAKRNEFIGVMTFRSLAKGVSDGQLNEKASRYVVQPARVEADASITSAVDAMSAAGVTIAFVYRDDKMVGVITITDLLERIVGFKLA